jgi:hypothetical protein
MVRALEILNSRDPVTWVDGIKAAAFLAHGDVVHAALYLALFFAHRHRAH